MKPLQLKSADFIPLSEVRSLIGQPLKVEIPQGKVTPEGIAEILSYLQNVYPGVELPCPKGTTFFEWIWLDSKQGTLPKRMAKWLKKRTQKNPEQKVIAEVGNLARRNSDENQTYYFRITDKFDWEAGQFGKKGGGCWWGARGSNQAYGKYRPESYAERFEKNEGLAVQFFKSDNYSYDNGAGRLWLYVEPSTRFAVTFNGYWDNEGAVLRLTRVLASFLGLSYKQCKHLSSTLFIYVNDNKGYFIGDQEALNFLKDASYVIPKKTIDKFCTRCASSFDQETLIDDMCLPCYEASRKCNHCCGRKDASSFSPVRTNNGIMDWCSDCISFYALYCEGCTNAFISVQFNYPGCVKVDQVYMCTKCTMTSRKCQDCGGRTLNTDAMDDPLCLRCEAEFEEEIRVEPERAAPKFRITFDTTAFNVAVSETNAAFQRLMGSLEGRRRQVPPLPTEITDEDFDCPF